jgi:hypothetical protein
MSLKQIDQIFLPRADAFDCPLQNNKVFIMSPVVQKPMERNKFPNGEDAHAERD